MTEPLRIAQVMGFMNGGGVESVVMNYYRHIDRSQVQFDFIVNQGSVRVPEDEIVSLGGRVFYVPDYKHLFSFMANIEVLCREQKWKIVHSHLNALSVFSLRAAKRAGVPVRIAHSHSTSGKGEFKKSVLKAVLKTQVNRYPTHRFACGQYAGEWLFGKNANFQVMHNAIELERFAFNEKVRHQVRDELGLSDNQFVIGHIGRFMAQKNHRFLIGAFQRVHELRPDAVLLLAGDGELRSLVEGLVAECGLCEHVRFLGQRSDAYRLYQAFDVFVLPSLYEGLCVVGIEAQMAGLPCVFSDTITREVALTENAAFLPIASPDVWAECVAGINCSGPRIVERTEFSRYDIDEAAKWLSAAYASLIEETMS